MSLFTVVLIKCKQKSFVQEYIARKWLADKNVNYESGTIARSRISWWSPEKHKVKPISNNSKIHIKSVFDGKAGFYRVHLKRTFGKFC